MSSSERTQRTNGQSDRPTHNLCLRIMHFKTIFYTAYETHSDFFVYYKVVHIVRNGTKADIKNKMVEE